MPPTIGTIRLEAGDGSTVTLANANARPLSVTADRELFRPPYSEAWFVDGDDLRGPERVEITLEIRDEANGIAAAFADVKQALADIQDAALIETPWGAFTPRGIAETTRIPIDAGYRLQISIATDGWLPDDATLLRLIDGRVWELR